MNSSSSTENPSSKDNFERFLSIFKYHGWIFNLIITLLLTIIVSIMIVCIIKNYTGNRKRKIQRQNVIIRKHEESKTNDDNNFNAVLLESNNNVHVNRVCFITDITAGQKTSNSLPYGPKCSVDSLEKTIDQTNHTDGLSNIDPTDSQIRLLQQLKKDSTDKSVLRKTHRSLDHLLEKNSYIVEFRQQEHEKKKRKFNSQVSIDSETSEKSCF